MLIDGHRDHGAAATRDFDLETGLADVDLAALRLGRLRALRQEMAVRDIPCCVLMDPVNLRYASGARNMQVFCSRNPARYVFVPLEGPVVLFEFMGCEHLARDLETVDEIRPATTASYVAAGPNLGRAERAWAAEIAALAKQHGGGEARIAIERVNSGAAYALREQGLDVVDAQEAVERARTIKSGLEVACIRQSLAAVETAVSRLEAAIEPGVSENQVWSVLHQSVIAQDGDYVETRLLSSGERTNPWFQESSPRVIQKGELVALDTDVVGCHGYYADFSRTFLAGDSKPSADQRTLYRLAFEQVHHNIDLLRSGLSFRELSARAWPIPERYLKHRYYLLAHGVGMTGEYPYVLHGIDYPAHGYDGVIEPGMTLCLESFIGAEDGGEGVKLEQQVLITETGIELLSHYPFDDSLLGREI